MTAIQNNEWTSPKLEEDEIKNPFLVIYRFFDYAGIDTHRHLLWELLKTLVAGTYNTQVLDKTERFDMVCMYERIERLVEAAHLIHLQRSGIKKKKKKRKV